MRRGVDRLPLPLTEGVLCEACKGTGADVKKTIILRRTDALRRHDGGYVRCWTCNGGGLDPAAYFRWGPHPPLHSKQEDTDASDSRP
jgi:hypothetical protein